MHLFFFEILTVDANCLFKLEFNWFPGEVFSNYNLFDDTHLFEWYFQSSFWLYLMENEEKKKSLKNFKTIIKMKLKKKTKIFGGKHKNLAIKEELLKIWTWWKWRESIKIWFEFDLFVIQDFWMPKRCDFCNVRSSDRIRMFEFPFTSKWNNMKKGTIILKGRFVALFKNRQMFFLLEIVSSACGAQKPFI